MYFHTDDTFTLETLERAVNAASTQDRSFRIDVDDFGRLRYKVGEGMWSAPIDSTPDPYRDPAPRAAFTTERVWLKDS
jgi:hypothetical protein